MASSSQLRLVTPLGFRPNSLFVGFERELKELHLRLHSTRRRRLGTCSVLVWGEVGSGKTHLTRQYFYLHRNEFPTGSFWVDCRSKESTVNGFWDIGTSIGSLETKRKVSSPPATADHITAVREGLEKLTGWLLVLDSLTFESEEDLDDFKRFIPDQSGNFIIITSTDPTLANRQRLLRPAGVKVHPLTSEEGCQLLYRSLGMKKPNSIQQEKALELVQDCQQLPLAIHGYAHALIEKGKALEKYSHSITNTRIATPFLEILSALVEKKQYAAWNLIALLSFYNHYVPVALIDYGKPGLKKFRGEDIEIMTLIRPEETRRDLDTTVTILRRSGLVERTLQSYPISGSEQELNQIVRVGGSTTQAKEDGLDLSARSQAQLPEHEHLRLSQEEDSTGLGLIIAGLDSSTERSSVSSRTTTSTIYVLRIHAVVQSVVREHLKNRKVTDGRDYWWWLTAAVQLLIHSYGVANERIKKSSVPGLVRDYREFEIQASRLLSFFPRSPKNAPHPLPESRRELRALMKTLKREIDNQSPSQSCDFGHRRLVHGSVFDRSSSGSEADPTTPTSSESWSMDLEGVPYESPTNLGPPPGQQLLARELESAIVSDTDSWAYSDTTEVAAAMDRSRRSSDLLAIFEGRPMLGKKKKDLGEWKPTPVPPALDVRAVAARSGSRSSPNSEQGIPSPWSVGSDAEATLMDIHNSSPLISGGERRLSTLSRRGGGGGGGGGGTVLMPKPTNSKLSPLASTFQPSNTRQAPVLKPPSSGGLSSGGGPQHRPWTMSSSSSSSSPRLRQALMAHQARAARSEIAPSHGHDLDWRGRYSNNNNKYYYNQTQGPDVPASVLLPSGYTSAPMTRDNSNEGTAQDTFMARSVPNELFALTLSDAAKLQDYVSGGEALPLELPVPPRMSHSFHGMIAAKRQPQQQQDQQKQQQQYLSVGLGQQRGEWAAAVASASASSASFSTRNLHVPVGETGEELILSAIDDRMTKSESSLPALLPVGTSGVLLFGEMEPVQIEEARQRVNLARARSGERRERERERERAKQGENRDTNQNVR